MNHYLAEAAPNSFNTGTKNKPKIQSGHSFQVKMSPAVDLYLNRFHTINAPASQAIDPSHPASQNQQATPVHTPPPAATTFLAFMSPITSGTVLLPVALSPVISLKS
ncbi:hypothetical protein DL765_004218 [Monosporascus sp. GIB2]|nr:hypothetical protein DL765_004218 [Monosporascus sp. GIB2]